MSDLNHLQWLQHDPVAFEKERRRLINELLADIPEQQRGAAVRLQERIDDARNRMPREKFLAWMANEMNELSANLDDQLARLKQIRNDLT